MFDRFFILPALLMLPLLTVAQTPVCTSLGGREQGGSPVHSERGTNIEPAASVCPDAAMSQIQVLPFDHLTLMAAHFDRGNQVLLRSTEVSPLSLDWGSPALSGYREDAGVTLPSRVVAPSGSSFGSAKRIMSTVQTPEPGTMLLFGTGLLIAGAILRRRRGNVLGEYRP